MTVSLRDDTCQLFVNAEEEQKKHQNTSECLSEKHQRRSDVPTAVFTLCFYVMHAHRLGVYDQVRQRS